ncbi:sugar transferase [Methylophaga sp. OBS1]|uniref:sugar transferase n=1 Tax=Methylophaga sp. OBS1 TaxID=2991933 RepID=UPI002253B59C|nr:sugar transferase [Methylophaga sp. OBS1]MCX4193368.1 sugar transferase [Methylophaga sp. OBS1]
MLKRIFDIIVSGTLIIVLLPVIVLIYCGVRLKLGAPVFFKQLRPGRNAELFELIKFRTMLDAQDKAGTLLSDEERLTDFGRLLRATSLDELPELWNVFKGNMSLVGPRPLLEEYLPLYSPEQSRRHEVRPGVTGWAQVNGRNNLSWPERFRMDVWYVENQSFWLDLKILLMTVKKVFLREDINQSGHATAEKFKGNDK